MHILLNILAKQHPAEFNQQWIQQHFTQEQIEWLVQRKILVKAQPKQTVACPSCDDYHPLHKDERGYYCVCGGYFSGREDIAEELVHRWRVSLTGLATFLAHQLKIKPDFTELLNERVWRIGRKKYQNRQFFLTVARADADLVLQRLEQQSQPSVVFWIGHDGQLPQINSLKGLFLSLNDLILDDKDGYILSNDDVSKQVKLFIGQSDPDSKIQTTKPTYQDGVIHFAHQKISLGKAKQQKRICSVLFKNIKSMARNWEIDDLLVENGEHDLDDKRRMSYYQSAREINQKVKNETGISDFWVNGSFALVFLIVWSSENERSKSFFSVVLILCVILVFLALER